MARIKDVAKLAGVSTSTVSLVLNNKGYVSAATRAKVEAAVKELHYVPSELGATSRSTVRTSSASSSPMSPIPSSQPSCTRLRLPSTITATRR